MQWDPALVVKLLGMVNSAAFGLSQPIPDVGHAASYLGRSQVEQVVLAVAVRETLPSGSARGFEAPRFWKAAAHRAALAAAIAARLHPARQAESFTIGMLQDMAVPVLAHAQSTKYAPVLAEWHREREASLCDLERDAFGWCHSDVGGHLGRQWNLPEALVWGIERHHDAGCTDAELPPAVRLVAVLRETEEEYGLECLVETARVDYGLEADWTREAIDKAHAQATELARMLA